MPTSVNERLRDEIIAHSISLHRYSNGVIRRLISVLNKADADLMAALAQALAQVDPSQFRVDYLESLLASVRQINAAAYREVFNALPAEMQALVAYEVEFQNGLFTHAIPAPVLIRVPLARVSVDQVYAAALSRPMQGSLLRGWAAGAEENRLKIIRDAVRVGYVTGKTTDQIIREIQGTARNRTDGKLEGSRRGLASIVQTALAHTASTARSEVYKANSDLVKAEQWVSTLDSRTSPMCRVRDGLRYTPDTHKPIGHTIPWLGGPGRLHWCCRSTSVPITKSYRELGLDIPEMPPGQRASMDGQVPADTTYGQWLARQSAARQDEVLGPTRGALYRKGGMPLDEMYSNRGEFLTLDQLRARDAAAFRRAGI